MAKKRSEEEEETMPSLTSSDASPGHYDWSPSPRDEGEMVGLHDDDRSCYSSDYEQETRRQHADNAERPLVLVGANHRPSRSISPRGRERAPSRPRPMNPSRHGSHSRPGKGAVSLIPRRRRGRFSYSRRASLGGTTVYKTPDMATLDTHLRSISGLRLQMDGTCNFLFEGQRFVVESTEETGEFLFYASFGPLRELQRRNKPKNLLRSLAAWNDELKHLSGSSQYGEDGRENSGLLRIDSSKPEGPHVAFIYYGRMDEIENAMRFQEILDEFVDDALDFSDKLYGIKEGPAEKEVFPSPAGKGRGLAPHKPSVAGGGALAPEDFDSDVRSPRGAGETNNDASNASYNAKQPSVIQKEALTLAAATTNNPAPSPAITSTDVYNATSKKSVFAKMIQSIKVKSGVASSENIGSLAYVDPSNPGCAFAINLSRGGGGRGEDEQRRPSTNKGSSFHVRANERWGEHRLSRGRSFHVGDEDADELRGEQHPSRGRSFHGDDDDFEDMREERRFSRGRSFQVGDEDADGRRGERHPSRGRSFHTGDKDIDGRRGERHPSGGRSFYEGDEEDVPAPRVPSPRRGHRVDEHAVPSKSHRKGSSFYLDAKKGSSSFHIEDNGCRRSSSRAKGNSFHHAGKRGSLLTEDSDYERSSETIDYERSNQSIDIYDDRPHSSVRARGLHRSEPVGLSGHGRTEPLSLLLPPPPPPRPFSRSRHRSSEVERHPRGREKPTRWGEDKDGERNRRRSRSRHRQGHGRMNHSDPTILSH